MSNAKKRNVHCSICEVTALTFLGVPAFLATLNEEGGAKFVTYKVA